MDGRVAELSVQGRWKRAEEDVDGRKLIGRYARQVVDSLCSTEFRKWNGLGWEMDRIGKKKH